MYRNWIFCIGMKKVCIGDANDDKIIISDNFYCFLFSFNKLDRLKMIRVMCETFIQKSIRFCNDLIQIM